MKHIELTAKFYNIEDGYYFEKKFSLKLNSKKFEF